MGSWSYPMVNGGMGNVCVAHHSRSGVFELGGDLWSWYRTDDNMASWIGTMRGAQGIGSIYARGGCFSLADPDACYIAVGVLKGGGGYFGVCKGIDVTRHGGPQYGGNLASGAAGNLPRPVGSLVDVSMGGGTEHVYTGAYNGLMHSTDKGQTWHTIFGHSGNWKAVAAIDDTTVLASLYQQANGVTLVNGSSVNHPAAPGIIHDLRNIAGTVWAVGPAGVHRWTGGAFSKHAAASAAVGTKATTIAGSKDGQVILIGLDGAGSGVLSTDGGASWQQLGGHSVDVNFNGNPNWLAAVKNGWGGINFSASHAAVDQVNPMNMCVAGRQGAFGTRDGGKTWHPCSPGGGEVSAVRGGPGADEFAGSDVDWTGWHTADAFKTVGGLHQPQTGTRSSLTFSTGGHTYAAKVGDFMMDGHSIADDHYRGAAVNPKCVAVSPSGKIVVGQYGGTILLGTP